MAKSKAIEAQVGDKVRMDGEDCTIRDFRKSTAHLDGPNGKLISCGARELQWSEEDGGYWYIPGRE